MGERRADRRYQLLGGLLFWGCVFGLMAALAAVRCSTLSQTGFRWIFALLVAGFLAGFVMLRRKIKAQSLLLSPAEQDVIDRHKQKQTRKLARHLTIYLCLILLATGWHAISGKTFQDRLLAAGGLAFASPFAILLWSCKRELRRMDDMPRTSDVR